MDFEQKKMHIYVVGELTSQVGRLLDAASKLATTNREAASIATKLAEKLATRAHEMLDEIEPAPSTLAQ